jgi:hypothetical protein
MTIENITIDYFMENWKNIDKKDIYFNEDDWFNISIHQTLSEEFIEKYEDRVDWIYISRFQNLSEQFIEKYKDRLDWYYISIFQNLSDIFIIENYEYINCYYLMYNKNIEYKLFQSKLGMSLLVL